MSATLFLIMEIIGTVAFAVSGATTAVKKNMDIFGVAILGLTTAVGGGIVRDLILGISPPITFQKPVYAITAICVSILIFLPAVRRFIDREQRIYYIVLLILDSVGLGIFTVSGIKTAYTVYPKSGMFLVIFVGVVTGVGGGVMRDIMADNTPYIFVKHFYATASLVGAFVCTFLWNRVPQVYAMLAGITATLVLRLLAAKYRWSLPKAGDLKQ
ncbi:MAG: TRIC cation channel family protein [Clostridia bacterium]|nr:TRIC cation channel family protein [Clostridia bacterium]